MKISDDITKLRQRWLEMEYDSIMSNNPSNFVWNVLKEQSRKLNKENLIDNLTDLGAFEDTEQ